MIVLLAFEGALLTLTTIQPQIYSVRMQMPTTLTNRSSKEPGSRNFCAGSVLIPVGKFKGVFSSKRCAQTKEDPPPRSPERVPFIRPQKNRGPIAIRSRSCHHRQSVDANERS